MRFPSVLCIGAAAIDRIATTEARPARLSTSNPGRIRAYPGGAARNMAEALARLGVPASLAAMIGADSDGDAILASLRGTGVDVTSVRRSSVHATPGYLAIHDGGGDIVLGVADMVAAETAPAALVLDALARLPDALVLADANLGTPALETLARSGRRLAACAISVEKSQRLRPLLGHIETLFLNRHEAAALTGLPADDPDALVATLGRNFAPQGVLGLGAGGAQAWTDGTTRRLEAVPATLVSTNGAGDTLAAATLAGWRLGLDFLTAAGHGMRAAALTVATPFAVSPELTAQRLFTGIERPAMHLNVERKVP